MSVETEFAAGDVVTIGFANGDRMAEAVVVHVPADSGDHWRFRYNGRLISINPLASTLESIELVKPFVDPKVPRPASTFPEAPAWDGYRRTLERIIAAAVAAPAILPKWAPNCDCSVCASSREFSGAIGDAAKALGVGPL